MEKTHLKYDPVEAGCDSIIKDRLSELPDEILFHIISFLPLKDAVRTLFLGRFGNLWTLLHNLVFDECSNKFIDNVMEYHQKDAIDTWEFIMERNHKYGLPDKLLRKWIHLALDKNPKVLSISYDDCEGFELNLPRLFTTQSITILKLTRVNFYFRSEVNMRSLRRLELRDVEMVEEHLKVLEVGCPCLRELFIEYPEGLRRVHFTARNIENLEIEFDDGSIDCPNLKYLHIKEAYLDSIELKDLSSVTYARIDCDFVYSVSDHQFKILHEKFQNAKCFHFKDNGDVEYVKRSDREYHLLGDKVCMQLEQCGNEMLVFQLNNWSLLALKSGAQRSYLLGICRLLRNSSFLEELILYVNVDFFCDCNLLLEELSHPCKMQYLKTVTIRDFKKQCKVLVQLMEFLLNNAVVLDKLVIVCNKKEQLTSTKGHEFAMEILSLPRASKNARVVVA